VFYFHSMSVFMFTVYCLMDPCGLISNKDDDDDFCWLDLVFDYE